jgi:hypothetical protein
MAAGKPFHWSEGLTSSSMLLYSSEKISPEETIPLIIKEMQSRTIMR